MDSIKVAVDWSITNLDTGEELKPPYPIEENSLKVTIGGNIPEQARFGFQDPIIQWTSGKVKTITFTSTLYAVDTIETIVSKFKKFEALALPDERLGRPPIIVFTLGSGAVLSETCIVESIDPDIPLGVVEPAANLGWAGLGTREPRRVDLNITLKKYIPFSQTQLDPTKPNKESYYLVVSAAEATYEGIARRFYGNPMLGDRLRHRHPEMPLQPTVGAKISIPAKSIILREVVTPAFHAFSETDDEAIENRNRLIKLRAQRQVNF